MITENQSESLGGENESDFSKVHSATFLPRLVAVFCALVVFNFVNFSVGFALAFGSGDPGIFMFFALPVLVIQHLLPIAGVGDTIIGVLVASLFESMIITTIWSTISHSRRRKQSGSINNEGQKLIKPTVNDSRDYRVP